MENFLTAIPAAAASPYALVAYAICAALFLFGGAKLRELRSILKIIKDVPTGQRALLIQATTGKILPQHITADQWMQNNRNQGILSLIAAVIVLTGAVSAVAMLNRPIDPPPTSPPSVEDAIETVESFLKLMDSGKFTQAWADFYSASKKSMPAERWLTLSKTYRAPLGSAESRLDAGSTQSEIRLDRRLNGLLIQYYTKFTNLTTPIQEQVGVASAGAPAPWRIVSYTVAVPPGSPLLKETPHPP